MPVELRRDQGLDGAEITSVVDLANQYRYPSGDLVRGRFLLTGVLTAEKEAGADEFLLSKLVVPEFRWRQFLGNSPPSTTRFLAVSQARSAGHEEQHRIVDVVRLTIAPQRRGVGRSRPRAHALPLLAPAFARRREWRSCQASRC